MSLMLAWFGALLIQFRRWPGIMSASLFSNTCVVELCTGKTEIKYFPSGSYLGIPSGDTGTPLCFSSLNPDLTTAFSFPVEALHSVSHSAPLSLIFPGMLQDGNTLQTVISLNMEARVCAALMTTILWYCASSVKGARIIYMCLRPFLKKQLLEETQYRHLHYPQIHFTYPQFSSTYTPCIHYTSVLLLKSFIFTGLQVILFQNVRVL